MQMGALVQSIKRTKRTKHIVKVLCTEGDEDAKEQWCGQYQYLK